MPQKVCPEIKLVIKIFYIEKRSEMSSLSKMENQTVNATAGIGVRVCLLIMVSTRGI